MNLIPKHVKCPNCSRILQKPYIFQRSKGDGKEIRYQCNRKICRGRGIKNVVSLRKGTWFGDSKLTLKKSLFLTYSFVDQLSYQDTIRETLIEIVGDASDPLQQKQIKTSHETICNYKHYCRDVYLNIVMDKSDNKIGGLELM